MTEKTRKIILGGFLFMGLLILLGWLHQTSLKEQKKDDYILYALFKKTDGVDIGAPVRLSGVPVGHVFKQELADNYEVRLTLSFNKKLELPLDTSVAIETDGFLGSKHIELIPGADEEMLDSGDTLEYTQDTILLDELLAKVNSYMEQKKESKEDKNEEKSN